MTILKQFTPKSYKTSIAKLAKKVFNPTPPQLKLGTQYTAYKNTTVPHHYDKCQPKITPHRSCQNYKKHSFKPYLFTYQIPLRYLIRFPYDNPETKCAP